MVKSYPEGLVSESIKKVFVCETDQLGSNPPSILKWQHLDSAGAVMSLGNVKITNRQIENSNGLIISQSNLTVYAHRSLNGRHFECSLSYNNTKSMLRAEGFLEVLCKYHYLFLIMFKTKLYLYLQCIKINFNIFFNLY